jgi:hypothetical protein
MTNALATWFANNLGTVMPAELVVFIVSLFPILECRGGLIVAALLGVKIGVILEHLVPVEFILEPLRVGDLLHDGVQLRAVLAVVALRLLRLHLLHPRNPPARFLLEQCSATAR